MKRIPWSVIGTIILLLLVGVTEFLMGRLLLGPDGHFGLLELSVNSNENSQRVFDAYSLTHIAHGLIFYGLIFLVARRVPLRYRFLGAVALEGVWEVIENTPFIIDLYRQATASAQYKGDSILNSLSDIFCMMSGFFLASKLKPWMSAGVVVFLEILTFILIRDGVLINTIMFIHPFEALKTWQEKGGLLR
jgi:hypothetical protein